MKGQHELRGDTPGAQSLSRVFYSKVDLFSIMSYIGPDCRQLTSALALQCESLSQSQLRSPCIRVVLPQTLHHRRSFS